MNVRLIWPKHDSSFSGNWVVDLVQFCNIFLYDSASPCGPVLRMTVEYVSYRPTHFVELHFERDLILWS